MKWSDSTYSYQRAYTYAVAITILTLVACTGEQETIVPKYERLLYKALSDGVAIDKTFPLMWKRCSEGQIWTGATCEGQAQPFFSLPTKSGWPSFAGYSDWRIPTEGEMATSRGPQLREKNTFPNNPINTFTEQVTFDSVIRYLGEEANVWFANKLSNIGCVDCGDLIYSELGWTEPKVDLPCYIRLVRTMEK